MEQETESQDFREQLVDRIRRYAEQRDQVRAKLDELRDTLVTTERRLRTTCELYRLEFNEEPPVEGLEDPQTEELAELAIAIKAMSADLEKVTRATERELRAVRHEQSGGSGQSWNKAVVDVLREAGGPLHVKELWGRMQAGGFKTASKDPLRSLASVLVRHPDVARVGRNTYGLASVVGGGVGEDDRRDQEHGGEPSPQLALDPNAPQSGTPYTEREEVA